jgi:AcrR family transcriptional regulator
LSGRSDARRNREKILAAAGEVFGRRGAAASTEDVAALAGVGIATVFRHFPTKQDLLEAVVLARLEHLLAAITTIAGQGEPDGFFTAFALFLAEARNKKVFGDVLTDAGEHFRTANAAIVEELWQVFATLIATGQAAGTIRAGFDVADVRALLAGAHQAIGVIGDDVERHQRLQAILLDGVRARH